MALPRVVVALQDAAVPSRGSEAAGPGAERAPGSPVGGAVLRVVLQDVGMMDVAAVDVGGALLPLDGTAGRPGTDELEVTLAVPVHLLQTGSRFCLRAHLDRDGSGELAAGDALTTVSVPVQAGDVSAGRRVEVPLTQV